MSTDPKTKRPGGSEPRPGGAESADDARADSGDRRSGADSDPGAGSPDRGQPRRNDDRAAEPQGSGDAADKAEAAAESNRNKDFDTPHVHSATTSRRV